MTIRTAAVLTGLAITLAGCSLLPGHRPHTQQLGERLHQRPLVFVRGGALSVSPEPVVFQGSAGDKDITWRLPPGTRFDGAGIVLLGRVVNAKGEAVPPTHRSLELEGLRTDKRLAGAFACQVAADQQSASCRPAPDGAPRGVYKYEIRVVHQGQRLTWDPHILHLD